MIKMFRDRSRNNKMTIVKDHKACTVKGIMCMSFFFVVGEEVIGFGLAVKTDM